MTTKDAVQSPTNSLFPSAERPFFYTDPSGDGSCFFSNEAERDAAMAEAIAAWCDEGWSEEVEQIFAGVVSHTVKQCDVQKKPQPCAVHPDHDYGDNDCEACIAWDEFPNHEFDEVCNYKPVALAPTAEQAEATAKLSTETVDKSVDILSAPTAEQAEATAKLSTETVDKSVDILSAPTVEEAEATAKLSTETVDKSVDILSAPTVEQAEGVWVDSAQTARYIVIGYGESHYPQASFANDRDELLDAVLGMIYTRPSDACDDTREEYRRDLADEDEWCGKVWRTEFEIGGIVVYDTGAPASSTGDQS